MAAAAPVASLHGDGGRPPPNGGIAGRAARFQHGAPHVPNFSDSALIVEEIALLKTRTSGATRTAAAANPIE